LHVSRTVLEKVHFCMFLRTILEKVSCFSYKFAYPTFYRHFNQALSAPFTSRPEVRGSGGGRGGEDGGGGGGGDGGEVKRGQVAGKGVPLMVAP